LPTFPAPVFSRAQGPFFLSPNLDQSELALSLFKIKNDHFLAFAVFIFSKELKLCTINKKQRHVE
jgi:hypothetical protein